MHCTCVRQTELPGLSRLMADVLYNPDRTASFYRHPTRDLAAFQAAAAEIEFSGERRVALIEALRVQNPPSPALDRLAQPGTVAVMTGQQVGLFSGPAYTIYKALHAIRLAEWLSENGLPAVPVFWLATEDHDFAEVNHTWVFGPGHRPVRLEMQRSANSQPVGGVTLSAPPVAQLREALGALPYAEEVSALVEQTYRSGETIGWAFASLLRKILARFDMPLVDPMLPAFRKLAAPTLRAAVEAAPELTAGILDRNRALAEAGYHAQVHVEDHTSLVFVLENGKRLGLRRNGGGEFSHNGRRFTTAELAARAEDLSPNALLRPVVQDSMLPTVAYIGGPAEIAYLAQSAAIYDVLLQRMPVAVPRSGYTILDSHSAKLLERYRLSLPDFFNGEDALRERVASRLVPPSLSASVDQTGAAVEQAVTRLRGEMERFDPTLAKALNNSERKIRHQIARIAGKAGRESLRRNEHAARDASSLYGLIYPERHLQERLYSMLPFLAKHGLDLIDGIYESVQIDCPDHRLMVV
jgi:bacillithiol biosynthesis cysteine-adding enzyme BshC